MKPENVFIFLPSAFTNGFTIHVLEYLLLPRESGIAPIALSTWQGGKDGSDNSNRCCYEGYERLG